jgi:hypothetical protein
VNSLALNVLMSTNNTMDNSSKAKDAVPSIDCYTPTFCTIFTSALSESAQSFCGQNVFQGAVVCEKEKYMIYS